MLPKVQVGDKVQIKADAVLASEYLLQCGTVVHVTDMTPYVDSIQVRLLDGRMVSPLASGVVVIK
jgi:hypothetical protein